METRLAEYLREIEILSEVSHPNVMGIEKVFLTDDTLYIFEDLVPSGSLSSYLKQKGGTILEPEATALVRQIVIAVEFLHSKNIAHRNIGPESALLTNPLAGMRVVLTNFGKARRIHPLHPKSALIKTDVGGDQRDLDQQSGGFTSSRNPSCSAFARDMCSIGYITAFVVLGERVMNANTAYHDITATLEATSSWRELSENVQSFVRGLMVPDEQLRPTASEMLSHAWFAGNIDMVDPEATYRQIVKHWRPRMPNSTLTELIKGKSQDIRWLLCVQRTLERPKDHPDRNGSLKVPNQPRYNPFSRKMHHQTNPGEKKRKRKRSSSKSRADVRAYNKSWALLIPTSAIPKPQLQAENLGSSDFRLSNGSPQDMHSGRSSLAVIDCKERQQVERNVRPTTSRSGPLCESRRAELDIVPTFNLPYRLTSGAVGEVTSQDIQTNTGTSRLVSPNPIKLEVEKQLRPSSIRCRCQGSKYSHSRGISGTREGSALCVQSRTRLSSRSQSSTRSQGHNASMKRRRSDVFDLSLETAEEGDPSNDASSQGLGIGPGEASNDTVVVPHIAHLRISPADDAFV